MIALSRFFVIWVVNYFVTRGIIPQPAADELLSSTEALLVIEVAIATALTLVMTGLWEILKAWPRFVRSKLGVPEPEQEQEKNESGEK